MKQPHDAEIDDLWAKCSKDDLWKKVSEWWESASRARVVMLLAMNHKQSPSLTDIIEKGLCAVKWTPVFGPAVKVDRGSLELRHGEWVSWRFRESFMPRVRRRFDAKFKSRVALEAIRGLKAISEIAKQFKVHPNQVTLWKKQLLDGAEGVFDGGVSSGKKSDDEPESAELYEQIGRMKVELEWLKKKVAENS